jgi:hypothetical protein
MPNEKMIQDLRDDIEAILLQLDDLNGRQTTRKLSETWTLTIQIIERPDEAQSDDGDPRIVDAEPVQIVDASPAPRNRKKLIISALAAAALLGLAALIVVMLVLPALAPLATVTIVPDSEQIRVTSSVEVIAGQADLAKAQISGRALSAVSMSQAKTVPATGLVHQAAVQAQGLVTFYNAATTPQLVPVRTLITSASGASVVTDQDVTVPAVQYPTLGAATVSAHAVLAGPSGNIAAGNIYGPCCLLNLSAINEAFTGGQVARDYSVVAQADIDAAAGALKSELQQSATAALRSQIRPGEALLAPNCTAKVKSDVAVGSEAVQVNVVVDESCTGMSYASQVLHDAMSRQVSQRALAQLGNGYGQVGEIEVSVRSQRPTKSGAVLQVETSALWYAQFSSEDLKRLAGKIAGLSSEQATAALLRERGVRQVEGMPGGSLPGADHIRILELYIPTGEDGK